MTTKDETEARRQPGADDLRKSVDQGTALATIQEFAAKIMEWRQCLRHLRSTMRDNDFVDEDRTLVACDAIMFLAISAMRFDVEAIKKAGGVLACPRIVEETKSIARARATMQAPDAKTAKRMCSEALQDLADEIHDTVEGAGAAPGTRSFVLAIEETVIGTPGKDTEGSDDIINTLASLDAMEACEDLIYASGRLLEEDDPADR